MKQLIITVRKYNTTNSEIKVSPEIPLIVCNSKIERVFGINKSQGKFKLIKGRKLLAKCNTVYKTAIIKYKNGVICHVCLNGFEKALGRKCEHGEKIYFGIKRIK